MKQSSTDFLEIDGSFISVKEIGYPFYNSSSVVGTPFLGISANKKNYRWHPSNFVPIINISKTSNFRYKNRFQTNKVPYIKEQHGDFSVIIEEGNLNFRQGINLMPFREFYITSNSCYTYNITNEYEFDKLAISPMLKIDSARLSVQNVKLKPNRGYFYFGKFLEFDQLSTGFVYVKNIDNKYGILDARGKELVPITANSISVVNFNEYEFYLVQELIEDIGGVAESKWSVFNYSGKLLSGYYDTIEILTSNSFKVSNNGVYIILNPQGETIYRYK